MVSSSVASDLHEQARQWAIGVVISRSDNAAALATRSPAPAPDLPPAGRAPALVPALAPDPAPALAPPAPAAPAGPGQGKLVTFEVREILANAVDNKGAEIFLIWWLSLTKPRASDMDMWEPASSLTKELLADYRRIRKYAPPTCNRTMEKSRRKRKHKYICITSSIRLFRVPWVDNIILLGRGGPKTDV